jgi:hypothetical protein
MELDGEEDTDPTTRGDKLIWEAKGMLKPYISDNDEDNDGINEELILGSTFIS